MKKPARRKVLFVCIGNACRSPMAEAIACRLAGDVMEASSAGLTPLGRVEPLTTQTLVRNGYRPEGLESKPIALEASETADLIINMSGWPKEIAFEDPGKVESWQVEDPYGADAELYQRIFEDIEKRVAELADRLRINKRNMASTENINGKKMGKP
ncbi:MAG TPA: low molecular weight phosphatase family protein [Candidatus Acidoferrum sp.]|nr:low molecular weight phosphatase family protein [Candidatus Acidoferrum sp.]